MKKLFPALFLFLLPALSDATPFTEDNFLGEWCLAEIIDSDDASDEFLELRFEKDGILKYRINKHNKEPNTGSYEVKNSTLTLTAKQGITLRKFTIFSVTENEFIGKYFLKHRFDRGACT